MTQTWSQNVWNVQNPNVEYPIEHWNLQITREHLVAKSKSWNMLMCLWQYFFYPFVWRHLENKCYKAVFMVSTKLIPYCKTLVYIAVQYSTCSFWLRVVEIWRVNMISNWRVNMISSNLHEMSCLKLTRLTSRVQINAVDATIDWGWINFHLSWRSEMDHSSRGTISRWIM